jgi:outer membrane receptor for ferric coprogen and ferric-rhodotorulic acid
VRLDQALAQTTGIQVGQNDTERTTFYARGFGINNLQIDGMPRAAMRHFKTRSCTTASK